MSSSRRKRSLLEQKLKNLVGGPLTDKQAAATLVQGGAKSAPVGVHPAMAAGAEHLSYPKSDWQYEVKNGDTCLGYADWVSHSAERDEGR